MRLEKKKFKNLINSFFITTIIGLIFYYLLFNLHNFNFDFIELPFIKESNDNSKWYGGPKLEFLLSEFDLHEFKNYNPKSISGGMRRKVSLARALIKEPQILLMDEPFVSLDQPTAESLYSVLIKYWQQNLSVKRRC